MNSGDITLTIFILWVFTMLHSFSKVSQQLDTVKQNWGDYRCKPSIMPFANIFGHDAFENFTYCIQNIQNIFMANGIGPVSDQLDSTGATLGSAGKGMGGMTSMVDQMRSNSANGSTGTFSIFGNAAVEFKRATSTIKDTIDKMNASATSQGHALNAGASGATSGTEKMKNVISKIP